MNKTHMVHLWHSSGDHNWPDTRSRSTKWVNITRWYSATIEFSHTCCLEQMKNCTRDTIFITENVHSRYCLLETKEQHYVPSHGLSLTLVQRSSFGPSCMCNYRLELILFPHQSKWTRSFAAPIYILTSNAYVILPLCTHSMTILQEKRETITFWHAIITKV